MIDPWITNSLIDSCAFDPKYSPEDEAASQLSNLWHEKSLPILIAHSTKKELEHPSTPRWVKVEASARIFSLETHKTPRESKRFGDIHNILTGNGKPENYSQDAEHVFEASRYGSYFVTTDRRILSKAQQLFDITGVRIMLPSGFLEVVRTYEAQHGAAPDRYSATLHSGR